MPSLAAALSWDNKSYRYRLQTESMTNYDSRTATRTQTDNINSRAVDPLAQERYIAIPTKPTNNDVFIDRSLQSPDNSPQ
ncbi:11094_t:CDS:2 [Ambispora gerdemannii]|uniref:11094_t:CDS:1 n=1 Tax=Ambispora gerdemannii TaxID=144530 RepID=A0A9N9E8J1_9GLOM|nr:11094_t:CDS:2 [Ambispora gerdemannii]